MSLGLQIKNTIKRLIPPFLRKVKFIAWLFRSLKQLRNKKVDFDNLREFWDYNRQFNTQTLSLETRLNQEHNLVNGSIFIQTPDTINESVYTFWLNENQTSPFIFWLSEFNTPTYIKWISETPETPFDFIIFVPSSLVFDEDEMRAIVDLYKLAGKRYTINIY